MPKNKLPRLLASELEILEMLWRSGDVTIIEAQRALSDPVSYTATQTRLDRMVKKGIVRRASGRPAKYSAGVSQDEIARRDLSLLMKRVSGGRVVPLVAHLMRDHSPTPQEIEELKRLISRAERKIKSKKRGES